MKILIYMHNEKENQILLHKIQNIYSQQKSIFIETTTSLPNDDKAYDLVFMEPCNQEDEIHELYHDNQHCMIIFMNDNLHYLHQAFMMGIFQYLPMHVDDALLYQECMRALHAYKKLNAKCILHTKKGDMVFAPKDILYIETRNHKLYVMSTIGEFEGKIDHLGKVKEKLMDYDFFQIHQSYFVNMNYLLKIKKGEVKLTNGSIVPTSILNRKYIKETINNFLKKP